MRRLLPLSCLLFLLAGCGASEVTGPVPEEQQTAVGDNTDVEDTADASPDLSEIPELLPQKERAAAPADPASEENDTEKALPEQPLKDLYADSFRMGVSVQAIDHWGDPTAEIGNPDKEAIIRREFNSMTFGNEWKPAYNFDPSSPTLYRTDPAAEELLTWAKENGIPVRGHTLVWHSQCNPAIFARDYIALSNGSRTNDWTAELDPECLVDAGTLRDRLRTYIRGVMEYTYSAGFADTVYAFDVVNEAVEEKEKDGLRQSYYYRIIGPEYLYYCFLFAREAELDYAREYASLYGLDPEKDDLTPIQPKLFYNDYNEWYPKRVEIITRFLTEDAVNAGGKLIRSKAIREGGDGTIVGDGLIDGIGMQGHLESAQNIDQYLQALRAYDAIVDEVQITELDVRGSGSGDQAELNQAEFCSEFFLGLLKERMSGVNLTSVTWWGLTDDASWRKGANPLLYRGDLTEKPAYRAIGMAALGQEFKASDLPTLRDATSLFDDFEPRTEDGKLINQMPADLGITSRGTGHQSSLTFSKDENHTENAPIGRSLKVAREEKDATVQLDISRFIGNTILMSVYAKTADSAITLGVTGDSDLELVTVPAEDGWVQLNAVCRLDEGLSAVTLYLETDGSSDLYLDDIAVGVAP